MPQEKPILIYVTPRRSSFSSADMQMLGEHYRVVTNAYEWWRQDYLTPLFYLRQLVFLLWYIPKAQAIVVSFGGYWALLPALLGKLFGVPCYIILNGTDCTALPEIGYGLLRKSYTRYLCGLSYRWATKLLPVSESLISSENRYIDPQQPSKQGVRHYYPALATPTVVLPNGVDPEFWQTPDTAAKEPKSFISVMLAGQYLLKGGELIVSAAAALPGCTFYIAGTDAPAQLTQCPPNVHFLGLLSPEELRSYYQRSQFSLQPSASEGFGLSVCEAMACECIPLVSMVNSLPELVGDCGLYLQQRNAQLLQQLIQEQALRLKDPTTMGQAARTRVLHHFTLRQRAERLYSLIGLPSSDEERADLP